MVTSKAQLPAVKLTPEKKQNLKSKGQCGLMASSPNNWCRFLNAWPGKDSRRQALVLQRQS